MTTSTDVRPSFLPAAAAIPAAVLAAAVVAVAADAVIALIAHHAGVTHDFKPLQFGSYTSLTIIGVLAGAIGWAIIRRRAADPGRLLGWLVPVVIAVSFIPDIALGVSGGSSSGNTMTSHTTWGGVFALMLMHLAVAACAVTAYRLLIPLPRPLPRPADHR